MKKLTTDEVIARAKKIYGDYYDYSKTNYIGYDSRMTVICPIHGEVNVHAGHFLEGHGCYKCGNKRGGEKIKKTTEYFIKKAREVHGDKYDYSKVEYTYARDKVCIICPIHGEFWQIPDSHLKGRNCPKCAHRSYRFTKDEFIEKAREVHGDKYDYSKVEYIHNKHKVCIICKEHGEFWQAPLAHLYKGQGCPFCKQSHLELEIKLLLNENNIKYQEQKRFSWLKYKSLMSLDFYLPEYNVAIECQGSQHFIDRFFFNKKHSFEERLDMDLLKINLLNEKGIRLLHFSKKHLIPKNWDKYEVLYDKDELLKQIKGE